MVTDPTIRALCLCTGIPPLPAPQQEHQQQLAQLLPLRPICTVLLKPGTTFRLPEPPFPAPKHLGHEGRGGICSQGTVRPSLCSVHSPSGSATSQSLAGCSTCGESMVVLGVSPGQATCMGLGSLPQGDLRGERSSTYTWYNCVHLGMSMHTHAQPCVSAHCTPGLPQGPPTWVCGDLGSRELVSGQCRPPANQRPCT